MTGKTFEELGFKPGDRVRCVRSDGPSLYKAGDEYVLERPEPWCGITVKKSFNGYSADWELVRYSDWIMANPGVTIPDNAVVAKAEDGSVVCFKVPVETKRETSTVWWKTEGATVYSEYSYLKYTHKITFETIDGEPACSTVKMVKL